MMTKSLGSTVAARVCLALFVILLSVFAGCGGGGTNPIVTPAPQQPSDQPVYRLIVLGKQFAHGGKVVDYIEIRQGEPSWVWARLESSKDGEPWTVVTQEFSLDITIEGTASGDWMVDVGLSGGQSWLTAGSEYKLQFNPATGGHLGVAQLKIAIPELGVYSYLQVRVIAGGTNPTPACRDIHPCAEYDAEGNLWDCDNGTWKIVVPAPGKTCREIHPVREAIGGFWWDCVSGVWSNTGEPVDQPGEFHAHGNFGILNSGGTLHIMKGRAETVQLFVGNSAVDPQDVTAELPTSLPQWVWLPAKSEISTVYTLGNPVYIPVGEYDFSLWYDGQELKIHLVVDYNEELP